MVSETNSLMKGLTSCGIVGAITIYNNDIASSGYPALIEFIFGTNSSYYVCALGSGGYQFRPTTGYFKVELFIGDSEYN